MKTAKSSKKPLLKAVFYALVEQIAINKHIMLYKAIGTNYIAKWNCRYRNIRYTASSQSQVKAKGSSLTRSPERAVIVSL